jgi:hypothetical protein
MMRSRLRKVDVRILNYALHLFQYCLIREGALKAHLALQVAYYHFVRPHLSSQEQIPAKKQFCRWRKRTPAMAAKITNHVWSLPELLTFRPEKTSTN